jgi:hypothetical protein
LLAVIHRIRVRLLPLLALLAVVTAAAAVDHRLALEMVPVFVMFGALLLGHFPGEQIIERLRRTPERRPRPVRAARIHHAPFVRRVGRATAFALSVRPPPVAALHR